jgi:hypothetical protein
MQTRHADQHTSDQFAKDRGQLKAHHQLSDGASHDEDHQEATHLQKGFNHFELMGADLQKKGMEHQKKSGDGVVGSGLVGA